MLRALLRDPAGLWPNALAIAYALLGYALGVALLLVDPSWLNVIGVLLTAHAMVISAYLIHEFAHRSIFKSATLNRRFGVLMTWINGSCYADFDGLAQKHLRHHADRADVMTFDYRAYLHDHPRLRRSVLALEWLYVPAVEILMHGFVIALPFQTSQPRHRAQRGRVLRILLLRVTLFALMAYAAPRALPLYLLAWLLCITVLRFMDAFQHTYRLYPLVSQDRAPDSALRDKTYEEHNTYSNLLSVRYPWLNLLALNFPYHNAHHERTSVPWYRLPALHAELYGDACAQVLPARALFASFHRNRVRRVLDDDYGTVDTQQGKVDAFVGALGVSFLTAV
jgi:fatty acid desaturase